MILISMAIPATKTMLELDDVQGWNGTADKQAPIPEFSPTRVVDLAAVIEPHRPEKQGEENQQQCPV